MRYRERLGEFRVWISKKAQFLDLFFCSGRMELTPEWFTERYGSPWAHGLMLLKSLWLFLGVVAVANYVLAADSFVSAVPTHFSILDYEDEFLENCSERESEGAGGDLLLLSFDELKALEKNFVVDRPFDRTFSRNRCNYEWRRLGFPSPGADSIVLSLVDPVFPDPVVSETSDEDKIILPLGQRSKQVYYPLDPYGGRVQLVEVASPILRADGTEDGVEIFRLSAKTVLLMKRGLDEYFAPGILYAEVHRFPSEGPEKNWEIADATLEPVSGRQVNSEWAMITGPEAERYGLLDVFTRDAGDYLNNVDSRKSEFDRLMALKSPNPTVTKLVSVVSTIAVPLLLVPVLSLIVVLIGQRDDERPFLEICLITSHILMASSFAFLVLFEFLAFFSNVFPTHDSLYLPLISVVMLWMLRFYLVQIPLQLTACCGYPVNWNARSWAFGLRRTCSVPSLLFRVLSLLIFTMYIVLLISAEGLGVLIQMVLAG